MTDPRRWGATSLLIALLAVLLTTPAHAYLDAGSASMLFQALIGAIAAALVFSKTYWARLKAAIGLGEKPEVAEASSPPTDSQP